MLQKKRGPPKAPCYMIKSTLKIARYRPLVIQGFSNFLGLCQVIMANPEKSTFTIYWSEFLCCLACFTGNDAQFPASFEKFWSRLLANMSCQVPTKGAKRHHGGVLQNHGLSRHFPNLFQKICLSINKWYTCIFQRCEFQRHTSTSPFLEILSLGHLLVNIFLWNQCMIYLTVRGTKRNWSNWQPFFF